MIERRLCGACAHWFAGDKDRVPARPSPGLCSLYDMPTYSDEEFGCRAWRKLTTEEKTGSEHEALD